MKPFFWRVALGTGMDGPRLPKRYATSLLIHLLVCLLFFRASRKFRMSTLQNIHTEWVKGSTLCGNLEFPSPRLACKPSEPQANSLIVAGKMQMCRTSILPLREQGQIHIDICLSQSSQFPLESSCPVGRVFWPTFGCLWSCCCYWRQSCSEWFARYNICIFVFSGVHLVVFNDLQTEMLWKCMWWENQRGNNVAWHVNCWSNVLRVSDVHAALHK